MGSRQGDIACACSKRIGIEMKKIGIVILAAVTALTSYTPANAMPVAAVQLTQQSDMDRVQNREWGGDRHRPRPGWNHGGYRPRPGWHGGYRPRPHWDGGYRPRPGWHGGGYRYGWYNGHRGYRGYRDGYRRHNDGWWYPLAAFGAGAIIGGAIAAPPRRVESGVNQRHASWCYDRYRSYRAWDNSFQPYGGPRQQCYSPYY